MQRIYANHTLEEADLDYTEVGSYRTDFDRLAELSDRCFFIVDLHTFEYVYTSENFKEIFGYIPASKSESRNSGELLDSKIHPDDFFEYKKNLLRVGEFIMQLPNEERTKYRHIYELRIRNTQEEYVWVSWERQPFQTDKSGNLWLMLGILHVLSNQNDRTGIKSFFINPATGEHIPFDSPKEPSFELTAREKQILQCLQQGLLSKEIADKLCISTNTVNIHRQNILHKMKVNNSLEAVDKGRKSGILK